MPHLAWIGKSAVEKHHLELPFRLIECDKELSSNQTSTGNLILEGDNLHALKSLLPYYAGRIKCIYIDPPYNTGNEKWKYNDNVNSPEITDWLDKIVGSEGEDLTRHDKWLCMMYPRIKMLKKLLSTDGSIFISIDDDEAHYLKVICDEIFGRNNFISNVIWEKKYSPQNDAKWLSDSHDHILVYAKNKNLWRPNLLPRTEKANARYKNPDHDPRGNWKSSDLSVKTYNPSTDYPITTPSGRVVNPPAGYCWRVSKEKLAEMLKDNRIWFGPHNSGVPSIKRFLSEVQDGMVSKTIWGREEVGDNQEAKQELKKLFPESNSIFDTPKPVRLIKKILRLATKSGDIVLDSFAGSGTTAQAVIELNIEEHSSRKYILIEMDQTIAQNITTKRINKVLSRLGEGESTGSNKVNLSVSLGFNYCKLKESIFDETGSINSEVSYLALARHIFFSETGVPIPDISSIQPPFIGEYFGKCYFLFANSKNSRENGLNLASVKMLNKYSGHKIVFAEFTRIGASRLNKENIEFKQIPYELIIS